MHKQAAGAILWNVLGLFFSLLNGVFTARLLAPGDRGVLALAITISSMSYVLASLGTNAALRTFQPTASWASFRTYAHVSIWLLGLDVVAVGVALVLFVAVGTVAASPWVIAVIFLLGMSNFASSQLLDVLNAVGRTSRSAAVNTVGHGLTAATLLVLFVTHTSTVAAAISAYLVGFIGRTLISLATVRRASDFVPGTLAPDRGRRLLTQGLRFWGMTVGQAVAFRVDLLLLGFIAAPHAIGIYAVAVAPAGLTQVISNSLGQVVYREAAVGRLRLRRLCGWALVAFGVASTYATALAIVAPWLIPLVFGDEYVEAVPVVRVLLLGELALAPYLVLVRALAGYNEPWWASLSGLLGSVIMFGGVALLTPELGVIGAATGVSVAYGTMLLIALFGLVAVRRGSRGVRSS